MAQSRRSAVGGRQERGPDRRQRQRRGSSTGARVLVAVPWAALAVVILFYGGRTIFALLVFGLGIVALHELYRLLAPVRPLPLAGFIGLAGVVAAAAYGDQFQMVLAMTGTVLLTALMAIVRPLRRHVTLAVAATLLGVFWIGVGLAHAVLLFRLDHGESLLFDVLLATFIGDTGAYFGGRLWGTTQLAPRISPAKTVEGLIAGLVSGTMAFWFAGLYQDWLSGTDALLIGAAVACAAPVGDLFESMVKRDLAVKDSGRFFGEHGGVLDRLDAALFTVIVGYYAANALLS